MTQSCETFELDNVCEGCPAALALNVRTQEIAEGGDGSESEHRLKMNAEEMPVAARALNEAAGKVACQNIEKSLPPALNPMPDVGTAELIEYVSECPSFPTYIELRYS